MKEYYYILFFDNNLKKSSAPRIVRGQNKKELINKGYKKAFVDEAERFASFAEARIRFNELLIEDYN